MPLKLKVDLHVHCSEDIAEIAAGRKDLVPAKKMIDFAVSMNYDAISLTLHGVPLTNSSIFNYANEKGLLLIPGVETFINRKHVLLINYDAKEYILTYEDLKRNKNDHMLVIAPHPYYKAPACLGKDLDRNIECFDAIEYSHYYYKFLNPNRKAVKIAKQFKLPIVGNSDTHHIEQFGTTYSYVYAEEKSIPAIIKAIKQGKIEYVSHPQSLKAFLVETIWVFEKLPYQIQRFFRKRFVWTSRRILKKLL